MPENTRDLIYEEVDQLRNADGLVTTITRKRNTGALSFSLMKEFDRDGQVNRSSFLARRQIDGAIDLLRLTGERMDQLTDQQKAAERTELEQRNKDRRRANSRRSP